MLRASLILMVCVVVASGVACTKDEPPTAPGPVPLRDADHMVEYLTSGEWRLVGPSANRWFRFSDDGTFEAGGDGLADLLGLTAAVTEVAGRWDADTTSLHLSEIGGGGLAKSLPLGWADGKLNIDIGGEPYRR